MLLSIGGVAQVSKDKQGGSNKSRPQQSRSQQPAPRARQQAVPEPKEAPKPAVAVARAAPRPMVPFSRGRLVHAVRPYGSSSTVRIGSGRPVMCALSALVCTVYEGVPCPSLSAQARATAGPDGHENMYRAMQARWLCMQYSVYAQACTVPRRTNAPMVSCGRGWRTARAKTIAPTSASRCRRPCTRPHSCRCSAPSVSARPTRTAAPIQECEWGAADELEGGLS
jgi:hypothetical protein